MQPSMSDRLARTPTSKASDKSHEIQSMAPSIERARSSRNWLRYWATTGMPASTACRTRADPTWPMAPVMRSAISGARDNRVNEPAGCDGPCGVPPLQLRRQRLLFRHADAGFLWWYIARDLTTLSIESRCDHRQLGPASRPQAHATNRPPPCRRVLSPPAGVRG